jgi:hypothetical protein
VRKEDNRSTYSRRKSDGVGFTSRVMPSADTALYSSPGALLMKILRHLRAKDLLPPPREISFIRDDAGKLSIFDRAGRPVLIARVDFKAAQLLFAVSYTDRPMIATAATSVIYDAPPLAVSLYVGIDARQAADGELLEEFCAPEGPFWLLAMLEAEVYYVKHHRLRQRLASLWREHAISLTPEMQRLTEEIEL